MPSSRRALVACAMLSGLLAGARPAAAQDRAFPARDVRIDLIVHETSRVTVREDYALVDVPGILAFQYLGNRCSRVGPVSATVGERPVTFDEERRGPWTLLRPSTSIGTMAGIEDGGAWRVRLQYEVGISAIDATVPVVLPAAVLERAEGTRGANVDVTVAWSGNANGAQVLFPRLDRAAPGAIWQSRLLAIPSVVRVRAPVGKREPCDAETPATAGGLEWRFWLFTGIMVVWVPLYLWVFGRHPGGHPFRGAERHDA